MKHLCTTRRILVIVATLCVPAVAACGDQPILSGMGGAPHFNGGPGSVIGSDYDQDDTITTASDPGTTTSSDTTGRGPGTIGSGH